MVCINFNWFHWLAEEESKKLETTAKPIYHSAYEKLSNASRVALENASRNENLVEPDRSNYLEWLSEEYREQRVALAAMTATLLTRSGMLHLKSIVGWVGSRFPLQSSVPKNGSELEKMVSEYRLRFGVELNLLPHFSTLREVVLARNSLVHTEGRPSKDYLQQTEKRCLDKEGNLNLTPELLDTLVDELRQFITELGREMSRATFNKTTP